MIKIISIARIVLLLSGFCSVQAFANDSFQYRADALSYKSLTLNYSSLFSVRSSTDNPVSSDPTLRTGTQNSESPQGSFFVVPAIMIGLFALVLFFKEK